MVEISLEALQELDKYFEGKDKSPIRIFLAPGGCSGPRLALALDEPADGDNTQETGGYTFCMSKELEDQVNSVKIELADYGFNIIPEKPLPEAAGGGCGGCCGGCGSH